MTEPEPTVAPDRPHRLVGRGSELRAIRSALDGVAAGRGRGLFLLGEPGVGKSRLLEEMAAAARAAEVTVVWGRCWEAGGAPSFWPWLQVLRGVLRQVPTAEAQLGGYQRHLLVRLLPELDVPNVPAAGDDLFALLDAVVAWLCQISSGSPLCIMLEDMHAADLASLSLLDHIVRQAQSSALLVGASARDNELAGEPAALLRRAAKDATVLRPAPLDRTAVAEYLRDEMGAVEEAVVDAVFAATEGNPLFLVEVVRWLAVAGPGADPRQAVPPTVYATIEERLARLPDLVRDVLAHAALLGREVDPSRVERAFDLDARGALPVATAAALGYPTAAGWRFSHVAVRDVLARSWPTRAAEAKHGLYAEWLAEQPDPPYAEVAHHFSQAGVAYRGPATEAYLRSAEVALAAYAYDDALRMAAAADELGPSSARAMTLQGLAHIGAGRPTEGIAACRQAFERAAAAGDAVQMGEAALACGAVYRFGEVDAALVDMLRRARRALDASHAGLRAKVTARLAAAQQPADDPAGPIALAREAIAEAEAAGVEIDQLLTLRAGCSALVDVSAAPIRRPLNARHLALATRLVSPLDVVTARLRLAFDDCELGHLDAGQAHLRQVIDLCEGDHAPPRVRWRAVGARALLALWSGDTSGAAREIERSREAGRAAGDPNADSVWLFQTAQLIRQEGRPRDLMSLDPLFAELWATTPTGRLLARVFRAEALIEAGAMDRAAEVAPSDVARRALRTGDHTMLLGLARLARLHRDAELAAKVLQVVERDQVARMHTGVVGMTWGESADLIREVVHWTGAEAVSPPPLRAQGEGAPARVGTLPGRDRGASEDGHPGPVRAVAEGDVWRLEHAGRVVRVKSSKGIRMLAHLLERPGVDVHVLDLTHVDGGQGPVDQGDGGVVIDPEARAAYRRRAEDLRHDLDEAEQANDLGRAERARAELEALTSQLLASTGLGGRDRRSAGAEERARQNVRKRLRDAITRIESYDADLGRHLERAVRTGRLCRYEP